MLSGIKVIPRDQLERGRKTSDSDSPPRKRKGSGSKKEKREKRLRRKKTHTDISEEEDDRRVVDKRRKSKKKKKERYVSDGDSSASSQSDNSGNGSFSEEECAGADSRKAGELARKEMGLDWMMASAKANIPKSAPPTDDVLQGSQPKEEVVKSNPRELNPYLKDDGSGYPDEAFQTEANKNKLPASSVVGDGGASWRLKALKRAREQATREGCKLDEIVEERWGSLGQLAVSVASHRAAPARAHLHAIKDRRRGLPEEASETTAKDQMKEEYMNTVRKGYICDVSSRHPEMRKPKRESFPWRKGKDHKSTDDDSLISAAVSSLNKYENDGSFMDEITHLQNKNDISNSSHTNMGKNECNKVESFSLKNNVSGEECSTSNQGLSSNQLAAKALQLRLKGKHDEAEKLLNEMEIMKVRHDTEVKMVAPDMGNKSRHFERRLSSQSKKIDDDGDLHLAKKIMKNKQYSTSKQADDEYDFDGNAPTKKSNLKRGVSEEKSKFPNRLLTQEQRCQFCFENPTRPKHLVVSIAQFTYMMLPQWQPVVQGHCCILTVQHEFATRTVDDNVWEEIRNFKKCLIMMFGKEDKDVIFLETVMGLAKQRRHCLVECIPLPRELAKEAPLYFKKAIDEAEDEWSQHNAKKLIPTTRQKGLRRSIPKDFPYFHVEFGLDEGFVHVIDDEGNFKSSIGLNVIRGMLQLSEEDMYRRRRHEPVEKQRAAVAAFAREWEPFDWTKQLY